MPNLWDYIHIHRPEDETASSGHNLQAGLFQIASQTCSILVQVNNTNNISYGNNATNINYNNQFGEGTSGGGGRFSDFKKPSMGDNLSTGKRSTTKLDREQSVVLLSSDQRKKSQRNLFSNYKHRLSTVLESAPTPGQQPEDDFELWDQSQMLHADSHRPLWRKGTICKPSCIPITVILVLIVLVVLLPLLDHNNDKHTAHKPSNESSFVCSDACNIQLVESIPEGLVYPKGSPRFMSTFEAWRTLIDDSSNSIDIGSFYWTLRSSDVMNHTSSKDGELIFQSLLKYGLNKNTRLRIAQNSPTKENPNLDTEYLKKKKAADIRSVNFPKLIGGGVLHTKVWVIDESSIYLGSANMDWRSLTQVKELGVLIQNCSCLAKDISKIFSVYWELGKENAQIPDKWPDSFNTKYNKESPLKVNFNSQFVYNTYFSSSPGPFNPKGRTHDLEAINNIIQHAEKFVYISVMDYIPLTVFSPTTKFWPDIDNTIRKAALENKVNVRLLISWWNHSRESEDNFLRSLENLSGANKGVKIEIKRFIVPSTEDQAKIDFARVNHNKYMVTDNTAYIGTSNWSGDYFIDTAGIGMIMTDPEHHQGNETTIRSQLESLFLRDWNSPYAVQLRKT